MKLFQWFQAIDLDVLGMLFLLALRKQVAEEHNVQYSPKRRLAGTALTVRSASAFNRPAMLPHKKRANRFVVFTYGFEVIEY